MSWDFLREISFFRRRLWRNWIYPVLNKNFSLRLSVVEWESQLSMLVSRMAQHKTVSHQKENQPSHLNVYHCVGSAKKIELDAVPGNFYHSVLISSAPILDTPPLSQGSTKLTISLHYKMPNCMVCPAVRLDITSNAFFKASKFWKQLFWCLFSSDEELFFWAAASSLPPEELPDIPKV